jgi:hypothetical protein
VRDVSKNAKNDEGAFRVQHCAPYPAPAGCSSGKPRATCTQPDSLCALSPFIRRFSLPLSERERDFHCGIAHLVREHAVVD